MGVQAAGTGRLTSDRLPVRTTPRPRQYGLIGTSAESVSRSLRRARS